jgi:Rhs element Vgr protein
MFSSDNLANIEHYAVRIANVAISDPLKLKLFEIEVSQSFNMPSMFTLRFEDDEQEILSRRQINLGDPVEIKLESDGRLVVVFNGEVTAIEPAYETQFRTIINVRGYDFSHRLTHGTHIRTFQNSKDSDIVRKMASEVGLIANVDPTSTVYDYVMQYNQTNMAFLRQLARRNNYKFYVDTKKKLNFKKASATEGRIKKLTWGDELLGFFPRMTVSEQVTEVTVRGYDPKTKKPIIGSASSASYLQEVDGEQKGGAAYKRATKKDAKHYEVNHGTINQTHANSLAQAILDELNADYIEAEGICDGDATLTPGMKVDISNLNSQFEGKYRLTSVRHIYNLDGYRTEFVVEGMRPETIADLVGNSEENILTNQPMLGVVPAIVTQNVDEDNMHRIRVQYPWLSDEEESWWARVAAPDAGPDRGITYLPEIGDEVLVAFEHGDIGRPYIVGRLWNGKDAAPHTSNQLVQSGKVNLRVIKSRSGHTITLNDTEDKELISIIDKTGNNLITIDSSTNAISIEANGAKVILKLEGEDGKLTIKAEDSIDIKSGGDMTFKSEGNLTLDAGMNDVEIKGGGVNIVASSDFSAKSSGGQASIEGTTGTTVKSAATVTVQGITVSIN